MNKHVQAPILRKRVAIVIAAMAVVFACGQALGAVNSPPAGAAIVPTGPSYCASAESSGYNLTSNGVPTQIDNVYACGPVPLDGHGDTGSAIPAFWPITNNGGFQCTELAIRYLYAVSGGADFVNEYSQNYLNVPPQNYWNGTGKDFVNSVAPHFGLGPVQTHVDGQSSALPQVGDILSEMVGPNETSTLDSASATVGYANSTARAYGDVGIVKSVTAATIQLMAENNNESGLNSITIKSPTSWGINDMKSGFYYNTFQWVSPASSNYEVAFQANTGSLWTVGSDNHGSWNLPIYPGSSPSIARLTNGSYEVAFESYNEQLWVAGPGGIVNTGYGMYPGSSPSITGLTNGGYEVAFDANTSSLWTVGSDNHGAWNLGMDPGSAPSITGLTNGSYEVAFQANTGSLWTVGSDNHGSWNLGMFPQTSPSITGLMNGSYEVAFQANTESLWTVGSDNHGSWNLGMALDTSPSITGLTNGSYEVAFQANTGFLWTVGSDNHGDWGLGMYVGTSPSIAGLTNGSYDVAFASNNRQLWVGGPGGFQNTLYGLPTSGYELNAPNPSIGVWLP
jgi:hypothetical protein